MIHNMHGDRASTGQSKQAGRHWHCQLQDTLALLDMLGMLSVALALSGGLLRCNTDAAATLSRMEIILAVYGFMGDTDQDWSWLSTSLLRYGVPKMVKNGVGPSYSQMQSHIVAIVFLSVLVACGAHGVHCTYIDEAMDTGKAMTDAHLIQKG